MGVHLNDFQLLGVVHYPPRNGTLQSGTPKRTLTLRDPYSPEEDEQIFQVFAYGDNVPMIPSLVKDGDILYVAGRLTLDTYHHRKNGRPLGRLRINARTVRSVPRNSDGSIPKLNRFDLVGRVIRATLEHDREGTCILKAVIGELESNGLWRYTHVRLWREWAEMAAQSFTPNRLVYVRGTAKMEIWKPKNHERTHRLAMLGVKGMPLREAFDDLDAQEAVQRVQSGTDKHLRITHLFKYGVLPTGEA